MKITSGIYQVGGSNLSHSSDAAVYLEFMLPLNADILCECHFGIIKGRDKVRKFIESYLRQ